MKVMVIVKATRSSEAGEMPSEQLLTEMGRYNEELAKAGIMLAGEGLHPSSNGARVRFSGRERIVTDGPFAETKELIAGFWLWKVNSMKEAIEWVKRCPNPMTEDSEIEIRQVFSADDFGTEFTPELREQEARIRAQSLGLQAVRFENGCQLIVAGLNGKYTPETSFQIPAQWERFVPQMNDIPGRVGSETYGVCWNSGGEGHDCQFDYLSGVEVSSLDEIPKDLQHISIPAQRYAVITHEQHISLIKETINSIWNKWLPDSGLKSARSPSFERYTEDFDAQTGFGGTEIWIPIQY